MSEIISDLVHRTSVFWNKIYFFQRNRKCNCRLSNEENTELNSERTIHKISHKKISVFHVLLVPSIWDHKKQWNAQNNERNHRLILDFTCLFFFFMHLYNCHDYHLNDDPNVWECSLFCYKFKQGTAFVYLLFFLVS